MTDRQIAMLVRAGFVAVASLGVWVWVAAFAGPTLTVEPRIEGNTFDLSSASVCLSTACDG